MPHQKTTIYNGERETFINSIKKVYTYRNLVWVFAKRDLQVKYAQTIFGFGWSVFKPLLSLFIYVFFFGYILNWTTGDIPYSIYVLSGLIGWNLFTYIISNGTSSIFESSDLIKKIYFPKSILVFSKMIIGLFETTISLALLIPLLIYYEIGVSFRLLLIPFVLLYNIICGLAVAFILASISIKKRDILQVLPFLIHISIWFTPVFLSPDLFPNSIQFIFKLNPIANVVELWRWLFFNNIEFEWVWLLNFTITSILMVLGFYLYSIRESKFADYI